MKLFSFKRYSPVSALVLGLLIIPVLAQANWMGDITFDHPSSSHLPNEKFVTATIHYKVSDSAGARIFIKHFTNG